MGDTSSYEELQACLAYICGKCKNLRLRMENANASMSQTQLFSGSKEEPNCVTPPAQPDAAAAAVPPGCPAVSQLIIHVPKLHTFAAKPGKRKGREEVELDFSSELDF